MTSHKFYIDFIILLFSVIMIRATEEKVKGNDKANVFNGIKVDGFAEDKTIEKARKSHGVTSCLIF